MGEVPSVDLLGAFWAVSTLLMFFDFRATGWSTTIMFTVVYIVYEIAYTINDISYWSMLPSLTQDQKEREKDRRGGPDLRQRRPVLRRGRPRPSPACCRMRSDRHKRAWFRGGPRARGDHARLPVADAAHDARARRGDDESTRCVNCSP